jgi:hypothetical protein
MWSVVAANLCKLPHGAANLLIEILATAQAVNASLRLGQTPLLCLWRLLQATPRPFTCANAHQGFLPGRVCPGRVQVSGDASAALRAAAAMHFARHPVIVVWPYTSIICGSSS